MLRPSPARFFFLSLLALTACRSADRGPHAKDAGAPAEATSDAAPPPVVPKDHSLDVPNLRGTNAQLSTIGLQAILDGYGIGVTDAALARETKRGAHGASIDDLDRAATKHGLKVEQLLLPTEAILIPEAAALPCLVVTDDAAGNAQFVVAWRLDGDGVQILDPAAGRKTLTRRAFEDSIHIHEVAVPAKAWTDYAASDELRGILRARMTRLGVPRVLALEMLSEATQLTEGRTALDAALRATEVELRAGAGNPSLRLRAFFDCTAKHACDGVTPPPLTQWTARPGPEDDDDAPQTILRGAVLLRINGRK